MFVGLCLSLRVRILHHIDVSGVLELKEAIELFQAAFFWT